MAEMGEVITIAEVAAIAGWTCAGKPPKWRGWKCACKTCHAGEERMRRHLRTQNEQLHGAVLKNVAAAGKRARWLTTLGAIKKISPQWFGEQDKLLERVGRLEDRLGHARRLVEAAHESIGELRRRLLEAEKRLAGLERGRGGRAA